MLKQQLYCKYSQLANTCPQGVPRTFPFKVPMTSLKDPISPFQVGLNLMPRGSPSLTSRERPNLTFKGRPWEVDLGRSQDVPQRTYRVLKLKCPKICLTFSFRTYSIDQIYLKVFQHSRCIENPVKLLRWNIFCKIS